MNLIDIKSLDLSEISKLMTSFGQPSFRAGQIFNWLHIKKCNDFSQMTNLPKDLISSLEQQCNVTVLDIQNKLVSSLDGTVKYLYTLEDSNCVETVLMRYKHGNSVCISTQVGCKMGCTFCASTKAPFVRNLKASEMLEQIYKTASDTGQRVSNVVLMGIGEPLDNYDEVVRFLYLVSHEKGNNLSLRHVSLSTCGLANKIYELANLKLQLTLSVSLHAPNDTIRNESMPVNRRFPISELITACRYYAENTGRRISFEYALIMGVNDTKACANELCSLLKGILCHVNLIPVNEIKESTYKKALKQNIVKFQQYLIENGINTTVRRTLGADINAACGQLRACVLEEKQLYQTREDLF